MIPRSCVAIETTRFPALPGEDEELVNERMYGKALCLYLQQHLPRCGITVPFFCAEDWGWWLEVEAGEFKTGLCVYADPDFELQPERYAILSAEEGTRWSWSRFWFVDISAEVVRIMDALEQLLREDPDIRSVTRHANYPF